MLGLAVVHSWWTGGESGVKELTASSSGGVVVINDGQKDIGIIMVVV